MFQEHSQPEGEQAPLTRVCEVFWVSAVNNLVRVSGLDTARQALPALPSTHLEPVIRSLSRPVELSSVEGF